MLGNGLLRTIYARSPVKIRALDWMCRVVEYGLQCSRDTTHKRMDGASKVTVVVSLIRFFNQFTDDP